MDLQLKFSQKDHGVDPARQKLLDEHHRLHLRVEELEHEVQCLHRSLSWRITSPLRSLKPLAGYLQSLVRKGQHRLALNPFHQLIAGHDGEYQLSGPVPFFIVESSRGRLPSGFVKMRIGTSRGLRGVSLYFDTGNGFNEEERIKIPLNATSSEAHEQLLRFPSFLRELRIDPHTEAKLFSLSEISCRERYSLAVFAAAFYSRFRERRVFKLTALNYLHESVHRLFSFGITGLKALILPEFMSSKERNWLYRKSYIPRQRKRLESLSVSSSPMPVISILMPVYNTPEKWLRCSIESVLNQTYQAWELCIVDDASTRPSVQRVLEEYRSRDTRIKVEYRQINEHISAASNSALDMATGEFIALLDHDDELHPCALKTVVHTLQANKELDLIYSDEDRINKDGERLDPYLKLSWDPELILSQNCISHLGVYRSSLAKEVKFRRGLEGSQDWDFALRFLKRTSSDRVRHIPEVLYHWRLVPGTVSFISETKIDAFTAGERAVEDFLDGPKLECTAVGAHKVLWPLSHGISDIEVLYARKGDGLRLNELSRISKPFVCWSSGELSESTLLELLRNAERKEVGVVGGRVLRPDARCWHRGFRYFEGLFVPLEFGSSSDSSGYFGVAKASHQVDGVSADLCMCRTEILGRMIRLFREQGSAPTELDLGLLMSMFCRKFGLRVLYCPFAEVVSEAPISLFESAEPYLKEIGAQEYEALCTNLFLDFRFGRTELSLE